MPSQLSGIRQPNGGFIWSWGNYSMLTGGPLGQLSSMALWQVRGKPFMVSEFDLNPANDFAAETLPLLSTLAALQGWDALAEYAWLDFQLDEPDPSNTRRIYSPFATTGHAGQMATVPAAALLFRLGLIDPHATTRRTTVGRDFLPLAPDRTRQAVS
jgi:hypothetical protein